ncbi:MAG: hypothetical protein HY560_10415, partial [Gemmatimonadetes bacterium]|nr:hypothetical protein [Gemmatimonadota bacterium]
VSRSDLARYARTYMVAKPYVAGVLISPEARQRAGLTPEQLVHKELVP